MAAMRSLSLRRLFPFVLFLFFAAGSALGQLDRTLGQSVNNWTVPSGGPGGLSKQVDVTEAVAFVGVTPCRIVDTRGPAGPYGAPSLAASVVRDFDLNSGPCSGIPAQVEAYSLNVTATNTAGPGFFLIYPQGGIQPLVSTLNYVAGESVANAAIVPAGAGGGISIIAGVSGADVVVDINGYFAADLNATNFFRVSSSVASPGAVIVGENSSTGASAAAILGRMTSASPGSASAAVRGINNGTSGLGVGVYGTQAGGGWGVWGAALGSTGSASKGVYGTTASLSNGAAGVHGSALGNGGRVYGVRGDSDSTNSHAAGVLGVDASGPTAALNAFFTVTAGVRGESSDDFGVVGFTDSPGGQAGVAGYVVASNGSSFAHGRLGAGFFGPVYYGVYSSGDYGGTGAKYFLEPHPERADLVIRYVALEGPESGTYFRGRGKIQNGLATIDVPEDFRLVTSAEGLSVQVTPIGAMATIAVMEIGLDRIVVKGSRNVEFFYTVNGVRRSHAHLRPIVPGREFMPEGPEATLPAHLTDVQKAMLVSNGTYTADGKVNAETARRLGWDKAWAARSTPKVRSDRPARADQAP